MLAAPTTEPAALQAGDTLRWQRQLPDYPADAGWVLAYRLINAVTRIDIVSTADGAAHAVQVAASVSAAYPPGDYTWAAFVTSATERHTIGHGQLRVLPDLAAAAAGQDGRSEAQRALADLRAALLRWLSSSGHVSEYEIAGRRMRFASAQDIRARIAIAEQEVAREAAALGQRPPVRSVRVRF